MILEYYLDKATAKKRLAQILARHTPAYPAKVQTVSRCVLSPSAVIDYTGETSPNGFGGPADQWWSRLYKVEVWL